MRHVILALITLMCSVQLCNSEKWEINDIVAADPQSSISMNIDLNDELSFAYIDKITHQMKVLNEQNNIWQNIYDDTSTITPHISVKLDSFLLPHILYLKKFSDTSYELYYSSFNGTAWFQNFITSGNFSSNTLQALDLDTNNRPHIIYEDEISSKLVYVFQSTNSWEFRNVSKFQSGGSCIKVDSHGITHICYTTGGNLYYVKYFDGVFQSSNSISGTFTDVQNCSLILDINDNPHICFNSRNGLIYTTNINNNWSYQVVNTIPDSGYYSNICIDKQQRILISYCILGMKNSLYYATLNNSSWINQFIDSINIMPSIVSDSFNLPIIGYYNEGIIKYARYDAFSPSKIENIYSNIIEKPGEALLLWISPGDDGTTSTLANAKYRIDYSTYSGYQFSTSTYRIEIPTTTPNQMAQAYTLTGLTGGTTYYFAMYTIDNADNISELSNTTTSYVKSLVLDHYEVSIPTTPVTTGTSFSITVTAKNNENDTLPNYTGAVALQPVLASNDTQSGSGVLGVVQATLVNGTVTIANQTYTKAENIKLKVTDADGKTGVSNQLTVTASSYGAYMTLTANPQAAINGQTVTLTIDAKDYYGNAVVNIPLTMEVITGAGVFGTTTTYTDTTGRGTSTFVPSLSGTGECVLRVTSLGLASVEVRLYVSVLIVASDGGVVIASDDPKTLIRIPPWLLKTDSEVNIKRKTDTSAGEGQEVEVVAKERGTGNDITDLDGTVELTVGYQVDSNGKVTNTDVVESDAASVLALYYHDGVQWQKLDGSTVDTANKTVTVKTSHLSRYALRSSGTAARSTSFRFTGIGPNPFTPNPDGIYDRVYFYYENPENKDIEVRIYKLTGALVRVITATSGVVPYWDGRNTTGDMMDGGVYLYGLKVGGNAVVKGTVVLGK